MGLEEIRRLKDEAGRPKPKKAYSIPKMSKKKAAAVAKEKEERKGEDTFLVRWYKSKMKLMSGRCACCGLVTETKIYQYAIMSICHLLPKRENKCPTVALHPINWIELCPTHHDMYDTQSFNEIEKWGCYETIRDRIVVMWPDIPENERRHVPEIIQKYIADNQPF